MVLTKGKHLLPVDQKRTPMKWEIDAAGIDPQAVLPEIMFHLRCLKRLRLNEQAKEIKTNAY